MHHVIFDHPFFKPLDYFCNGPHYLVDHEDLNQDNEELELHEDVGQGCTNDVADSQLCALYASLGEVYAEIGLPHPPVIASFLEDLPSLLRQAYKNLRDVPFLQDELRLPNCGPREPRIALLRCEN